MNRLYSIALAILSLSALAYFGFVWQAQEHGSGETINEELIPDFIAESLRSELFNKQGKLSVSVNAQRMEHYGQLDFTHFEFPEYTLYPANGEPWTISANEATLQDDNRIILESRVLLQATDKSSLIQQIHCKYLELDLNTNIISSDQTILIQGKDFTMYGSGLIVDLNTTQMTLTEHVQTIYKKSRS